MIAKLRGDAPRVLLFVAALLLFSSGGCGLLEEDQSGAGVSEPEETDAWAVEVVDVVYGEDAGFNQKLMPDVVLGPPSGGGSHAGSLDVVSLGDGGTLTLSLGGNRCVRDGEGDDLTVLENVFFLAGVEDDRFIETARVEVSQDGEEFFTFPTSVDEELPPGSPDRYAGFAGVEPTLPGDDPAEVGGDRFDLEDLGLEWARFVRITDTAGDPWDSGDEFGLGFGKAGFDLDAVGAIHLGMGGECE